MIPMKEVVNLLCESELVNLAFVDLDTKELNTAKLPSLVRSINLGALELHKRFNLKEGTLVLNVQPGQNLYFLRQEFQEGAKARPSIPVQYISALPGKFFTVGLLKVEKVLDSKGYEYKLNEEDSCLSVYTPQADVIEIPDNLLKYMADSNITQLTVKFRKAPVQHLICEDFADDWSCKQIDLPYTHLQALVYFVAKRSHNSVGFTENSTRERIDYNSLFEQECANLDALNLRVDRQGGDDRLRRGGWV